MRRKFLSVVLCVCMMMMTMVPFAFAAGDDTTNSPAVAVAKIGDVEYSSLESAVHAATSGKTIQLVANTKENITINKNLTLDLNGFTLNGGQVQNKPALTVTAKVTVKDSSTEQTGTIKREDTAENSGTTSHYVIDIQGNGWLTFESGNVENNSGIVGVKGASLVRVGDDNVAKYPGLNIKGGTFTQNNFIAVKVDRGDLFLNGGTINSANSYAIENWLRTTIKAGTVNGSVASWTYSGGASSITKFNGGTINGNVNSVNYGNADGKKATVTITGGTITGELDTRSYDPTTNTLTSINDPAKATIEVTGGTFTNNPSNYLADGSIVKTNSDGNYEVEKTYLATVGGTGYYTWDNAYKAQTTSGEPIILQRNYTTNKIVNSGSSNRTIDLNGYTLTYTGSDVNSAAFEINYPDVTLTVKNGTVVSSQLVGLIPSAMNGTITYDNSGLVFDGLTMMTTGRSGIESNGNNANDTIILKDCTLNVPNGFGIYFPSSGTVTLENSKIKAKTLGVQICAGNLNVKDSDITVTAGPLEKAESDGAIEDGSAISVVDRTGYKGLGKITIENGNFAAKSGNDAVEAYKWENKTKSAFDNSTSIIAISGGHFTSDPTAYVASGYAAKSSNKSGYTYMVATKDSNEVIVKPTTAASKVDADKIPQNNKDIVTNSAKTVTVPEIANAAAKNVPISNSQAQQYVNDAKTNKGLISTEGQEVIIYVQSFLDVTPTAYDEGNKTYTLDITPKYQIIASTATTADKIKLPSTAGDTTNTNAVVVKEDTVLNVTEPTQVSLTLPNSFVTALGNNPTIYVKHVKDNGKTYIYTASLNGNTLTFTNPHGFSEFTVTTTAPVATVNGVGYESLQDAVDAVKDNETINVTGTGLSAIVSGSKTFKVTGQPVTLTAASGYNLTKNGNTYTVSHQSSGGPGSSGGSISTPTTYAVNVNAATNGAVAADKKTASKGTTVTVTASPSKGYVVDAVKVVDKDGKDVAVTGKDGKYVFTMPSSAVTVTGSFKAETPVALPFTDVKSGDWFYPAVQYAYAQGLMTGTSATTFAPNGTMNRAMIVTVLYRLEKSPAVTGASKFTDVPAGQWYSDAVAWAAANKIVNGYDETTFGPMNAVTREQMAAILFRYEQAKGLENVTLEENLNRFPDQNKISAYAIPALQWAVGQKIINGNADGTLDPTGTATRAQVAQIFTNLLNQ